MTFTPIAKNFMSYCRLIYMLSILCVRLTIKVKVGIPESFKVGWYPPKKKTGSSRLNKRTSKGLVILNKHYLIVNTIFCHSNLAMMKYHESKHLHLISCQPINRLDTPRGQNRFHLRVELDMWGANMKGSNSTWGETFGYHL